MAGQFFFPFFKKSKEGRIIRIFSQKKTKNMAGQSVFFQKSKRAEKYASFHKKSRKAVKSECFKKSRRAGKSTSFKNQGGQKNPHPLKINKSGATWLLLIFSILIHDQKLRRAGKSSSFKKSRRAGNPASVHKKSKYGGAIRFSLKKIKDGREIRNLSWKNQSWRAICFV